MALKEISEQFYLVREDVLPESMKKTIEAKLLIERGKVHSVAEAVQRVDLSRSAFYKYRDTVFPFSAMIKEKIITIFLRIEDRSGTLSNLLQAISNTGCNVLTINQTIPLQGIANVTLAINTAGVDLNMTTFLNGLNSLDFVERVEILGSGA